MIAFLRLIKSLVIQRVDGFVEICEISGTFGMSAIASHISNTRFLFNKYISQMCRTSVMELNEETP